MKRPAEAAFLSTKLNFAKRAPAIALLADAAESRKIEENRDPGD
jgi:hypothetical protein